MASDTGSLDLHAISAANAQWLGRILYDNLVYLNETGQPTPWLAKSWTISPDGKTYTFYLRDDVTFSDGAKFNAEAVAINLDHMRDPATKSPLAGGYIAPYDTGRIVSEYVFEAKLREPYTPFLSVLAQSWLAMESPKAIKERPKTLGEAPVGSGPFVLESYAKQRGMVLVKRPDYQWSPPLMGHQGPAYLDRIEIEFVSDAAIRYYSLASGEYDFSIDLPPQSATAVRAAPNLVLENRVRMGCPSRAIAFNTKQFPFDDVRLRKATAHAIDREGIVHIAGFGEYKPIANFLAENTPYFDPSFEKGLRYDPGEANRLFDEAGWTGRDAEGYRTRNGQRLQADLVVSQTLGTSSSPLVTEIQADLKKVGFNLRLVQVPAAVMTQRRATGNYQAITAGVWHTNTPDALYINYHSSQIPNQNRGGQNTARLDDPALDDLLSSARHASDPENLKSLYSQAQARLIDLAPGVPVYDFYSMVGYHRRVQGVIFDTSHETPIFETIWLRQPAP
ncbi:ABC transporter substrate-binding protein [Methylosinus sp. H3A]|uniref:ABC transporter substrate-binding protein n=1 Tax=Methylosinus sp. H3A TaxID=2785786 RepID=UPI001AEEA9D6|nr:ABC transporter substrate-binding protein [Methylosinus sp. H3A]